MKGGDLTPIPRFLPAVQGLRCHAVIVRTGDVRARCPHAQAGLSDLCRFHKDAEARGVRVVRVKGE